MEKYSPIIVVAIVAAVALVGMVFLGQGRLGSIPSAGEAICTPPVQAAPLRPVQATSLRPVQAAPPGEAEPQLAAGAAPAEQARNARCTDSDGSRVDVPNKAMEFMFGNVQIYDYSSRRTSVTSDYCKDSRTLMEQYCSGNARRELKVDCSGSCRSGACSSQPPTTIAPTSSGTAPTAQPTAPTTRAVVTEATPQPPAPMAGGVVCRESDVRYRVGTLEEVSRSGDLYDGYGYHQTDLESRVLGTVDIWNPTMRKWLTATDYCKDSSTVMEQYCYGGPIGGPSGGPPVGSDIREVEVRCARGCVRGACS